MRRLVCSIFALALSQMLAGCALPPAISAVAYLMDGATLFGTGKTMSDHALSAMTQEDCALWRVATGERVCQGPGEKGKPSAVALAAAETVYPGDDERAGPEDAPPLPAGQLQLAAIAPQAGGAPEPVPAPARRSGWEPILTIGEVAAAARRGPWPLTASAPAPVANAPAAAHDGAGANAPATIRTQRRLLEFRTPIEFMARRPQGDG